VVGGGHFEDLKEVKLILAKLGIWGRAFKINGRAKAQGAHMELAWSILEHRDCIFL
jgi:hypothetical protein